jgi:hypothetical protein
MKAILATFAVVLALMTLLSTLGGSLNRTTGPATTYVPHESFDDATTMPPPPPPPQEEEEQQHEEGGQQPMEESFVEPFEAPTHETFASF